jgi:Domain of unknown function (DUF4331)
MSNKSLSLLMTGAALMAASMAAPAMASSHREAPGITMSPKLDATDFYMFRSYEAGRADFMTMIANYQPFEDPRGGPNYFQMDPAAFYDIDIDNVGDGQIHQIYRFTFQNNIKGLSVPVGKDKNAIPLINDGPIPGNAAAALNVTETYKINLFTLRNGAVVSNEPIMNANGGPFFHKPTDDIGNKSLPNYDRFANTFIEVAKIPGCATPAKVFVGQRKDPFYVNLGETFDLVNYKNPIGEANANTATDTLAGYNVTSIAIEVPIKCVRTASNPIVGAWTTASKVLTLDSVQEVSRLGNPLVNELVIGLPDKDKWNASQPSGDAQFAKYVTNPTLPVLLHALYPSLTAPTQLPRQDLVAVFLTGVSGLNQPKGVKAAEEMRLNTTIASVAAAKQNPLGVIAGDNAGYPNGRRPADDVVDISLRVVMGKLYALGLFGGAKNAPSGNVELTDGVRKGAKQFPNVFPYLVAPLPGSPEAAYEAAVKADR